MDREGIEKNKERKKLSCLSREGGGLGKVRGGGVNLIKTLYETLKELINLKTINVLFETDVSNNNND